MQYYNKARAAKAFDKLRCIQLLLKYWSELREHCVSCITSYDEIQNASMQILIDNMLIDPDIYLLNLTAGKQRTQILIEHIDRQLAAWHKSCGSDYHGRMRRRIINGLYLEHPRKTLTEIAAEEKKPIHVIRSNLTSAFQELSALVFGADGLLKFDGAAYMIMLEETQSLGGVYPPA